MRRVTSTYTPSNMDRGLLRRILVERDRLLDLLVERLARSMTSSDRHHILVVGPRGSGKTHLVTLVEHELAGREELGDQMRIAWLGEDETISSLVDLAFAIAGELARRYPSEFQREFRESVRGLRPDAAAASVLLAVVERLQHRNLLLIMENMDRAFDGLGDLGRKKWRAFLQEQGRVATLATAQQLFSAVSSRDEAFFGFFDVHHLRPLTVDGARELISKIGVEQGKSDLEKYLDTPEGRYRIRALHHLAGGNQRLYVMLSEFLTKEALDDLVAAFERLAEDLTPYFQERIRALPPQQARIVECLCSATGAMTVKEIAEDTFIDERTCAKQLGNLRARSYVRSHRRGKESFYEVTEPLLRLCLDVKNQRGRPLKLVAQFLRAWFSDEQLRRPDAGFAVSRCDEYCATAVGLTRGFDAHVAADLKEEIEVHMASKNFERATELADELRFIEPLQAEFFKATIAMETGDYVAAVAALSAMCQRPDFTPIGRMAALLMRSIAYRALGDFELAIADSTEGIEIQGGPSDLRAMGLMSRGQAYGQQGDLERSLSDYRAVVAMIDAPPGQRAKALLNRGLSYQKQDHLEPALSDFTGVIEMRDAPKYDLAWALLNRALLLDQMGDSTLASSDCAAVVAMSDAPSEPQARALLYIGAAHWFAQRYTESEQHFAAAIALPGVSTEARTIALFALPEPMVMTSSREAVIEAVRTAFRDGDPSASDFGGTPHDLLAAVLRRGPNEWPAYVTDLAPLYIEHGAADKLGQGLIRTIAALDAGAYSAAQLDTWNSAWQEAGAHCEGLALPLLGLAAATEAIKTKSDRPLLRLPAEIRTLIRPLLTVTLGPLEDEP